MDPSGGLAVVKTEPGSAETAIQAFDLALKQEAEYQDEIGIALAVKIESEADVQGPGMEDTRTLSVQVKEESTSPKEAVRLG